MKSTVTEFSPAMATTLRGSPGLVPLVAAGAGDVKRNDDKSVPTVARKIIFDFMAPGQSSQRDLRRVVYFFSPGFDWRFRND
jgi:hypothetical protein